MELETIFEHSKSENQSCNGSNKAKHNHENPLFFDVMPQAVSELTSSWYPERTDVKCPELPEGWNMQATESGKVLFVNTRTSEQTFNDPRSGKECYTSRKKRGPFFSSPPSPLSLMDVLTDRCDLDSDREALVETIDEELEEPNEERLLPIGGVSEGRRGQRSGKHQHMSLLDRVWQVLGSAEDQVGITSIIRPRIHINYSCRQL